MTKVIDFQKKREESIETKRRDFERVMFDDFLGTYTVVDEVASGYPVKMIDISKDGCMFQVPAHKNNSKVFGEGVEITLKFYFTKGSYIPAVLNIKHSHEYVDNRGDTYVRYGGTFDKSLPSFKALKSFIDFIYNFAEFSCIDKGESKVYFL